MYPISQDDWNRYTTSVLDHGLNVAVLVIAGRLFPGSFDVSDDAPDTYEKLVALFESGRRFVVYEGGSENTIFGDPAVNHHFRAWHDWCHWKGRHDFSMGGVSNRTALAMVFKLIEGAQKSWRRLDGHNQLPKLVLGVTFNDGIEVIAKPTDRQPTTAAA